MKEYQKKPDITGKFKPVKFDKRIEITPLKLYIAIIDDGMRHVCYHGESFIKAQESLNFAPSDVYEGSDVPFSVFYPGRA